MEKIFNPTLVDNEKYYYLTIPSKVRVYDICVISEPVNKRALSDVSQMIYVRECNRDKLEAITNLIRLIIDFVYLVYPMNAPSDIFENNYLYCNSECDVMNISITCKNCKYVEKNFYIGENAVHIASIVKYLMLSVLTFVKSFV